MVAAREPGAPAHLRRHRRDDRSGLTRLRSRLGRESRRLTPSPLSLDPLHFCLVDVDHDARRAECRADRRRFPMAGVLPFEVEVCGAPQGHGYVELLVDRQNPFFPVGTRLNGREFHYSRIVGSTNPPSTACAVLRGTGCGGGRDAVVSGSLWAAYTTSTPWPWLPASLLRTTYQIAKWRLQGLLPRFLQMFCAIRIIMGPGTTNAIAISVREFPFISHGAGTFDGRGFVQ